MLRNGQGMYHEITFLMHATRSITVFETNCCRYVITELVRPLGCAYRVYKNKRDRTLNLNLEKYST